MLTIAITTPAGTPSDAASIPILSMAGVAAAEASEGYGGTQVVSVDLTSDVAAPGIVAPFDPAASVEWTGTIGLIPGWQHLIATATDDQSNIFTAEIDVFYRESLQLPYLREAPNEWVRNHLLLTRAIQGAVAAGTQPYGRIVIQNTLQEGGSLRNRSYYEFGVPVEEIRRIRIVGRGPAPWVVLFTERPPEDWSIQGMNDVPTDRAFLFVGGIQVDAEFTLSGRFERVVFIVLAADIALLKASVECDLIHRLPRTTPPFLLARSNIIP